MSDLGRTLVLVALAVVSAGCNRDKRSANGDVGHSGSDVNIYLATGRNTFARATRPAPARVYVPNSRSGTVTIINPATYRAIDTIRTGKLPQHVVPAYDLKTLWVTNDKSNSLTPIDPVTGRPGPSVPAADPYNLYFTPDGRFAIVIAEQRQRFDFLDPHSMRGIDSLPVDCKGLDHMEFTADGRFALATCEFSGQLVKIDLSTRKVVGYLLLDPGGLGAAAMPQDIRSGPDGRVFYVADMKADGVFLVDPDRFTRIGFLKTGRGAHGIVVGRLGRPLYVTNRGWNTILGGHHGPGSISVIDPDTRTVVENWPVPGGGSPDMGNVSGDGTELWVSGRYDDEVYVFNTATGQLTHRIPVGAEPHGLCVWPQPGRYSLGHTGNMR